MDRTIKNSNRYFSLCSCYYKCNRYLMRIRMLCNVILKCISHDRYNCGYMSKKKDPKRWCKFTRFFFPPPTMGVRILKKNIIIFSSCHKYFNSYVHFYHTFCYCSCCISLGLALEADILISHLQKLFYFTLTLPLVRFLNNSILIEPV